MVRISRRPAAARGVECEQHRLRLHGRAAARVRAGGRRALRVRRRGAAGAAQRSGVREERFADPFARRSARPQGRAAERVERELPAARGVEEGRRALRRDPARVPAAGRCARRVRKRQRRRVGGMGPVLCSRTECAEGAYAVRLYGSHADEQFLRGDARLRAAAPGRDRRDPEAGARNGSVGERSSCGYGRAARAEGRPAATARRDVDQARAVRRRADRRQDRRRSAARRRRVLRGRS
ncbi:ABC-type nitrate/sulfonate/bicarbonate transport systems periplasmic component [Burkholderia dolosa AU0158]|nr:ABC-type nitrate/sulfonate/bicarbonate transport systems periplasmic component [Burkholderia dolosa AU0158]